MPPKTIVAEITRNWPQCSYSEGDLISQKFERVVETNRLRGYWLVDWKFTTVLIPSTTSTEQGVIETIIAVFERQ